MTNKDYQALMDLAERQLEKSKTLTKEEAIQNFVNAGIMNPDGSFTEPYSILEQLFTRDI